MRYYLIWNNEGFAGLIIAKNDANATMIRNASEGVMYGAANHVEKVERETVMNMLGTVLEMPSLQIFGWDKIAGDIEQIVDVFRTMRKYNIVVSVTTLTNRRK